MIPAAGTIAAIATPAGRGGIGMVRISGPETEAICRHGILMVRIPKAESAQPRRISVRAS